jgi:hypothetical protein
VFQARRRLLEPLQVTLHEISPEFDCGAILAQRAMENRGQASLLADTARLFCIGAQLFIETVDSLRLGRSGEPQVGSAGYDSWPSAVDVDELRKRGVSLFDRGDLGRLRCLDPWCK